MKIQPPDQISNHCLEVVQNAVASLSDERKAFRQVVMDTFEELEKVGRQLERKVAEFESQESQVQNELKKAFEENEKLQNVFGMLEQSQDELEQTREKLSQLREKATEHNGKLESENEQLKLQLTESQKEVERLNAFVDEQTEQLENARTEWSQELRSMRAFFESRPKAVLSDQLLVPRPFADSQPPIDREPEPVDREPVETARGERESVEREPAEEPSNLPELSESPRAAEFEAPAAAQDDWYEASDRLSDDNGSEQEVESEFSAGTLGDKEDWFEPQSEGEVPASSGDFADEELFETPGASAEGEFDDPPQAVEQPQPEASQRPVAAEADEFADDFDVDEFSIDLDTAKDSGERDAAPGDPAVADSGYTDEFDDDFNSLSEPTADGFDVAAESATEARDEFDDFPDDFSDLEESSPSAQPVASSAPEQVEPPQVSESEEDEDIVLGSILARFQKLESNVNDLNC